MEREHNVSVLGEGRTIRVSKTFLRAQCVAVAALLVAVFGASMMAGADTDGILVHCVPNAAIDPSVCDDGHATIQAAVTHAEAGETVLVGPGTYVEQVTIADDDLVLISQMPGLATIKAPASMADPKAIVLVSGATGVTIEDFTIAGPVDGIRYGIRVDGGGSATIKGNHIKDIRDDPLSGAQSGVGILVGRMFEGETGSAHITYNTIDGYQKGGIVVDNAGSYATITYNTIEGGADTGAIAQNGIQVSRDADAVVAYNNVAGNWYTGDGWTATGILIFETDAVEVDANIVDSSQVGVAIESWCWDVQSANSNVITSNVITGAEWGVSVASVAWVGYSTCNPEASYNLVEGNTVTGSSGDEGVFVGVFDGSATYDPTTADNIVTANAIAEFDSGVHEDGATGGEVSDNVIEAVVYGVLATGTSALEVSDNAISGAMNGIRVVEGSSDTTVSGNLVFLNTEGIHVEGAGMGTAISFNSVEDNTDYGVRVMTTDGVTIHRNSIAESDYGIRVGDSDSVSITDNTITKFSLRGIVVEDSGTVLAPVETEGNTVDGDGAGTVGDHFGIWYEESKGTIAENFVTDIEWRAIVVYSASDVDVLSNLVTDYRKSGIDVRYAPVDSGERVLVQGNTVVGLGPVTDPYPAANGIQLTNGAVGDVIGNDVSANWFSGPGDWTASGILIFEVSDALVEANTVADSQTGIAIEAWCLWQPGASDNTVTGNRITGSQWGVSVTTYAHTTYLGTSCDPEASGNVVDGNVVVSSSGDTGVGVGAIWVSGPWTPTTDLTVVRNNVVTGFETGIKETGTTSDEVSGNVVRGNGDGVVAEDTTGLKVTRNAISGNTGDGFESLGGNVDLVVSRNTVRNNDRGIVLADEETADSNVVSGNTDEGILVQGDGNTVFRNTVRQNGDGIKVLGDANSIRRNVANNNVNLGIWIVGESNLIERNVALSNGVCDAQDDGTGNVWQYNVFGCFNP